MKLHNKNYIKNIFEEREITPSKKSWDTLSSLLDEQLPLESDNKSAFVFKKTKNYKPILSAAAVLFFAFTFVFWTLKNDEKNTTNLVVNSSKENKSNTQTQLENESKTNSFLKEIIKESPKNKLVEEKLKSNIVNNYALEGKTPIINQEVDVLTNDSVSTGIIPKVQKQVHIVWEPTKSQEIEIDLQNLIRSVERELIQDRAAERLDQSKDKLEQIRFAILNRNIEK